LSRGHVSSSKSLNLHYLFKDLGLHKNLVVAKAEGQG